MCSVEHLAMEVTEDETEELWSETCQLLLWSQTIAMKLKVFERYALENLRRNGAFVVLPTDKGEAAVVMKSTGY